MQSVINQIQAPAKDYMFPLSEKVHYTIRNIIDHEVWTPTSMVSHYNLILDYLHGINNETR